MSWRRVSRRPPGSPLTPHPSPWTPRPPQASSRKPQGSSNPSQSPSKRKWRASPSRFSTRRMRPAHYASSSSSRPAGPISRFAMAISFLLPPPLLAWSCLALTLPRFWESDIWYELKGDTVSDVEFCVDFQPLWVTSPTPPPPPPRRRKSLACRGVGGATAAPHHPPCAAGASVGSIGITRAARRPTP
jgi:hypothetical protein